MWCPNNHCYDDEQYKSCPRCHQMYLDNQRTCEYCTTIKQSEDMYDELHCSMKCYYERVYLEDILRMRGYL